jgi:hypothetical protein
MEATTVEVEMYNLLGNFLSQEKLSFVDIQTCHNICNQYEKKLECFFLGKRIKSYCNKNEYNIDFTNDKNKIEIISYDSPYNKDLNKGKEKYYKIDINWGNDRFYIIYEYLPDRFNDKHLFHQFYVDGALILKKENNSNKKPFINLTYLKELINRNNMPISIYKFLNLFLEMFNEKKVFEDMLFNIQLNPDDYLFDTLCSSESDISSIDEQED